MNLQSLVVVAVRLMALDFFLRVAVQLTPATLRFLRPHEISLFAQSPSWMVFPLLMLAAMIAGAVLLWVLALPIARFVTRGVPRDLSFGAMSLVDCYSIAFMAVGLFNISSHLPLVLNWAHYLFKEAASTPGDDWKERVPWYDASNAFIPFFIGVVLFVKGRTWSVALAAKQKRAESEIPTAESSDAPPKS